MKYPLSILFIGVMLCGATVKAQQTDSLKQAKIKYIGTDLGVADKKAEEVLLIMEQYKDSAKKLIADKSLSEDALKLKFSQLIDEKSTKLKKVLTEQQLQKMVPASERRHDAPVNIEKN